MVLIGCNMVQMQRVNAVLDTGAGPSLIRESLEQRIGKDTRNARRVYHAFVMRIIDDLVSKEQSLLLRMLEVNA